MRGSSALHDDQLEMPEGIPPMGNELLADVDFRCPVILPDKISSCDLEPTSMAPQTRMERRGEEVRCVPQEQTEFDNGQRK
jgi:hypothetical protein